MKAILILNAGSSSIKFAVFGLHESSLEKKFSGIVDHIFKNPVLTIKTAKTTEKMTINLSEIEKNSQFHDPYERAIHDIVDWLSHHDIDIIAAGHRVAHGGQFKHSMIVTDEVLAYLQTLNNLAPLHQPFNVKGVLVLTSIFPRIFQAVCFDTSFHTECHELSQRFAIPKWLYEEGVRRYGFHGLSYAYVVSQFDRYLAKEKVNGKIIIAHLGAGASMCAVDHRKSVATTLSFSALDGLPMGTRCGNIDPGVLLYLMETHHMGFKELMQVLYKESGLLGLSGGMSSDMRELEASDSPDARLAIDVFCYKIGAWVGMLAAELQGLEGIVFTAGIGENSALVREKVCHYAAWLGADMDREKNQRHENSIHTDNSRLALHVIPTNEELMIAEDTFRLFLENKSEKRLFQKEDI